MAQSITGIADFAELSARLKEAGATGLRRELYRKIDKSAQELAKEIGSAEHLYPYMPNHYADTLAADLKVRVVKRSGQDPHLTIIAEGRAHKRKVKQLNDRGLLEHPVFARGLRKDWTWRPQFSHVRQGFFDDPVQESVPKIRQGIEDAMSETARKLTTRG